MGARWVGSLRDEYRRNRSAHVMLLGKVALCLGTAILLLTVWSSLGVPRLNESNPDRRATKRLFTVLLPGMFLVASALTHALARGESDPRRRRRLLLADAATYMGLPLCVVLLMAWSKEVRQTPAGILYLGLLGGKAWGLFAHLLRRESDETAEERTVSPPRAAQVRWVAGVFLFVYLFHIGYHHTVAGTVGDEPHYLLIAHSLIEDGDVDLADNVKEHDYRPFYWRWLYGRAGRTHIVTSEGNYYSITYTTLFPLLLIPGYALAGWWGATFTVAGFGTATIGLLYVWLRRLTGSGRTALLTTCALGLTYPLLTFTTQAYPEMAAALITLGATMRLSDKRPLTAAGVTWLLAGAAVLAMLHLRFSFTGLAIAALTLAHAGRRVVLWVLSGTAVLAAGVVAAGLIDRTLFDGILFMQAVDRLGWRAILGHVTTGVRQPHRFLAIFGDQELGLCLYAPVYLLTVFGLPVAFRKDRRATVGMLTVFGVYLYFVLSFGRWWGGVPPPARYLPSVLPLLGWPIAAGLRWIRHRVYDVAVCYALLVSYCVVLIVSVSPGSLYSLMDSTSPLLERLGDDLDTRLYPFFPSFANPSWRPSLMVLGWVVVLVATAVWFAVRGTVRREDPAPRRPASAWLVAAGVFVLAYSAMTLVGKTLPTTSLEGEAMQPDAGGLATAWWQRRARLAVYPVVLSGEGLLRSGRLEFTVLVGATSTDRREATIELFVGNESVGAAAVPTGDINVEGREKWLESSHVFTCDNPRRGWQPVGVSIKGLHPLECKLYLDAVWIRRVGPSEK